MTAEQCVSFLEALRVKNIYVKDNGWVVGSCPLAKWLHKSHNDKTPSFGLSVSPGTRSYFLCFACRQGSVEELLSVLEMYTHQSKDYDWGICHQILADEEFVVPLPEYGEFQKPPQVFQEWPAYWRESFQKAEYNDEALKYLTFRGVSMTTIQRFDLRFDSKRQMIIAPYWDVFYRLAGARGRAIVEMEKKSKHHDYSWQNSNNARIVWYNEPVLNLPGPVVVVEGQFDCWRTEQAHPKTVANLMAMPVMEKMKKLGDCGTVIQIPDRDEAGEQSVGKYANFCHKLGLKHKVLWLDSGVKDPAECSFEYLRDKITELI